MKKYIPYILAFLFLGCVVLFLLISPDRYEYHSKEITYSEPDVQYGFLVSMDCTETAYARYYFEPTIDQTERSLCIGKTDTILERAAILGCTPEIYIFTSERYPHTFISDHSLFSFARDWQSVEYAADVLMAAYGAYSHYGLAYGYASAICGKSLADSTFKIPETVDALDLNLLCFDSAFVSASDVIAVKSLACDFVQAYIAANDEPALQELLSSSQTAGGAAAVSDALAGFYRDNGIDYAPAVIRYGYGGYSYDYTVLSDLAVFYIEKDWYDVHTQYNPLVYDGFLHQNYADVKAFFQTNLDQMQQYQELFALDSYNNDLCVIFANTDLASTSFYQLNAHRIFVQNVDSLMHEYIHALTQPGADLKLWEVEGFARYFSYRYDDYGIAFLNQDYNNPPDTPVTDYVREYLNVIQRPIDMAVDHGEIENIAVWCFDQWDPNKSYLSGSSFVQYLVGQYGERAVINSIYGDKTPLPRTYRDLVREWIDHIENSCHSYSKYSG